MENKNYLNFGFFTFFDKYSPFHFVASVLGAVLFGFMPSFLFGVYYDISQSYMPLTCLRKHWKKLEKAVFTSDMRTDGFDILLWDLGGAMFGGWLRTLMGMPFYGFMGA